jgi:hypothetical protein
MYVAFHELSWLDAAFTGVMDIDPDTSESMYAKKSVGIPMNDVMQLLSNNLRVG